MDDEPLKDRQTKMIDWIFFDELDEDGWTDEWTMDGRSGWLDGWMVDRW